MSRCDYPDCRGVPVAECYNLTNHSWNYLCSTHFKQEFARLGDRRGWCILTTKEQILTVFDFIWRPFQSLYWTINAALFPVSSKELDELFRSDDNE